MGLFDFHLRPLADVQPWGTPPDLSLSWFGLTDGFYRLRVGEEYLFSYSAAASRLLAARYPGFQGDYADYQVVRLWEDLCEILPDVLTPVPPELGRLLAGPTPNVLQWLNHTKDWLIPDDNDPNFNIEPARYDLFESAVSWLDYRRLDSGHLQGGPRIWLWSTPDEVTLSWDNRDLQIEGVDRWSAHHGSFTLPRSTFMREVSAFDEDFLNQMSRRVEEVCAAWPRHEIRIDLAGLRREHVERTQTLAKALTTAPQTPDWEIVLAAVNSIGSPAK
jgi:Family of unknown function (DUF5984)